MVLILNNPTVRTGSDRWKNIQNGFVSLVEHGHIEPFVGVKAHIDWRHYLAPRLHLLLWLMQKENHGIVNAFLAHIFRRGRLDKPLVNVSK